MIDIPHEPSRPPDPPTPDPAPGGALARLAAALSGPVRGPAPVERWNPPDCGTIDLRIAADGSWHYAGTPIGRPALVRLFASVLRRDPERYVLVTPVERLGLSVDDLPFCAIEMAVSGEGAGRHIAFRTNVDDLVEVDADHPLRFEPGPGGGTRPAVRVRGGLWARITRALAYDLLAFAEEKAGGGASESGESVWGVSAGGLFFPVESGPGTGA